MSGGLEGVVVADTVLSLIDPPNGRLWVRGVALPELLARHGYEGTVALLWDDFAGEGLTRTGMQVALGAARQAAFAQLDRWLPVASSQPLETAVRVGLAMLPDDSSPADIASTLAVGVPALLRAATGQAPLAPDSSLSVAADLLRMLHGTPPAPEAARALDTYFTVMSDSGMSPSSFTARVVASTRASVVCAVLGGVVRLHRAAPWRGAGTHPRSARCAGGSR